MTTAAANEAAHVLDQRPMQALVKFVLLVLSSSALALLTVLALVFGVPDKNDYGLASVLKHDRLDALVGNKIVLVGGSNLAFGVVSPKIEERTGCPVVNMGMNGYFGVRFMLEEVKPSLRQGDVVVVAFEWDNYFKSIDGSPVNLFGLAKSNPQALTFMTWKQRFDAAVMGIPLAAQAKVRRAIAGVVSLVRPPREEDDKLINQIESLAGFTADGDLVSHIGVRWPGDFEQAILGDHVDPDVVPTIAAFADDMQERGVRVIVSFTPYMDTAFAERPEPIEKAFAQIQAAMPGLTPSRPQDYLFDASQHFDTVYHLNDEGRHVRSERLAADIIKGDPATCGGPA